MAKRTLEQVSQKKSTKYKIYEMYGKIKSVRIGEYDTDTAEYRLSVSKGFCTKDVKCLHATKVFSHLITMSIMN